MKPDDFDITDFRPDLALKLPPSGAAFWREYAGKVVALVNGEVRASGQTWGDCLRAAGFAHLVNPDYWYVPKGDAYVPASSGVPSAT